jgi:hypothetical protein
MCVQFSCTTSPTGSTSAAAAAATGAAEAAEEAAAEAEAKAAKESSVVLGSATTTAAATDAATDNVTSNATATTTAMCVSLCVSKAVSTFVFVCVWSSSLCFVLVRSRWPPSKTTKASTAQMKVLVVVGLSVVVVTIMGTQIVLVLTAPSAPAHSSRESSARTQNAVSP